MDHLDQSLSRARRVRKIANLLTRALPINLRVPIAPCTLLAGNMGEG